MVDNLLVDVINYPGAEATIKLSAVLGNIFDDNGVSVNVSWFYLTH